MITQILIQTSMVLAIPALLMWLKSQNTTTPLLASSVQPSKQQEKRSRLNKWFKTSNPHYITIYIQGGSQKGRQFSPFKRQPDSRYGAVCVGSEDLISYI